MSTKGMRRYHKFELNEVLPHIGAVDPTKFWVPSENRSMTVKHLSSQRMLLIKRTQCCAACLVPGTHFWLEHSGYMPPHFNLYATSYYGGEMLMTMDHILPRSKGGKIHENNIQLLCAKCNHVKRDFIIGVDQILQLRFKHDSNLFKHVFKAFTDLDPEYGPKIQSLYDSRTRKLKEILCLDSSLP